MIKFLTLISTLLYSGLAFAQIPNPDFENWTHIATYSLGGTSGYDQPVGWCTLNSFIATIDSNYSCTKGINNSPAGSDFLALTTQWVSSGIMPGVAATGSLTCSGITYAASGGYPFTLRPANITGMWQFASASSDNGHIVVLLSKWNTFLQRKDTVSFTDFTLSSVPVTSWTSFSIPLNYMEGSFPDSALIILASGGLETTPYSYLYIDSLAFTGSVPSNVITVQNNHAETTIFPDPATDKATIYYYSLFPGQLQVSITDVSGKAIRKQNARIVNGSNNISLNLDGLLKGDYMVYMTDGMGTDCKKLVVE